MMPALVRKFKARWFGSGGAARPDAAPQEGERPAVLGSLVFAPVAVPRSQATLELLPWPYPYRAGFTLANDCEFFDWEDFCRLAAWLTTRRSTPLGPGLGLPLSGSFWFYSEDPEQLGFSYFDGVDGHRPSRLGPYLAELLKLGFLDTLHTYGGFDLRGSFTRAHAEAALAELDRLGVRIRVWTNHGNAQNIQNLGGRWANAYAQGDVPGSPAYHADLLGRIGLRYFWLDAYATNRFSLGTPEGRDYQHGLAEPDPSPWADRILCPDQLRDGQPIVAFRRFRGRRRFAPDPSSLADQIAPENLDHLEATGGGAVLYQHLGCFRGPDGRAICGRTHPFPSRAIRAMEELATRYHQQRIWVGPCGMFLRRLEILGLLRIRPELFDGGIRLVLSAGGVALEESDLAGISLRLKGRVACREIQIAAQTALPHTCRSYRIVRAADDETIISWPVPAGPEFPFLGTEIP